MSAAAARIALLLGCALAWPAAVRPATVQGVPAAGSLAEARRLFGEAAYEPALEQLDGLRTSAKGVLARDVESARALCLLALGRELQAREAMAAVVDLDPLYVFPETEVAPSVVALFSEVRTARLPGVIRERFARAREAFGREDYEEAASGFEMIRALLALPEITASSEAGTFEDMRTLAAGFHDLAAKLLAPPAPPEPAPAAPSPRTETGGTATPGSEVGSAAEVPIEPPAALDQRIDSWELVRRPGRPPYKATLSVVIDQSGRVESVRVLESNDRFADLFVSNAAQQWRYRPATRNGVPVKYTKVVSVAEPVPR